MRINPNDVFQSFFIFSDELYNVAVRGYEEYETQIKTMGAGKLPTGYQHKLFNLEEKIFLLTYIFNTHNIDKNIIIKAIRSGKFTYEETDFIDFLKINPILGFYRYILLKDLNCKYNIGYFTENIRIMIKTLVGLNIFFLDAYILCKVISEVFNWKRLKPQAHSETIPLCIGFNNILMVGYTGDKPYLTVNGDGMKDFTSYTTGKISVGLYSGDDLLYCRKISVPDFNQDVREAIFNNEIGEDRKVKWSDLLPEFDPAIEDCPLIYREVTDWLSMIGLF